MKSIVGFLNTWQDTKSLETLKKSSNKSKEVQKVEIENYLRNMSLRFERSPRPETLQLWASDIINSGYEDWMVEQVCKSIPFKFERHPTLNQIIELIRPYLGQTEGFTDPLDKYTQMVLPHIKRKFLQQLGQDRLTAMCKLYQKEIVPNCTFDIEIMVLCDWVRCYFGDSKKIIEQGKKSNDAYLKNDKEYFIDRLRACARDLLLE
jgi:hypothetical protein